jgi:hypothetical protein
MNCKHSIFTSLLLVLLGTACTSHLAEYDGIDGSVLTFRTVSDTPETRTQLLSDGSIVWSPEDAITIVYGNRKGTFVSTNKKPASTVTFKGTLGADFALDENKSFLAVYPQKRMSSEVNEDGTTFSVAIPSNQPAVEGGFDYDIFPSAARSKNFDLYFYNLCGGIKFSLANSGVKKVVFRGNNNERLAGLAVFNFQDGGIPTFSRFSSYNTSVTLSASGNKELQTGVWYYLAAVPCRLSQGYTLELHYADNHVEEISSSKPVEIKRARWGILANLGNADPGPKAELTVSPMTLDFGEVTVGETEKRALTITNTGDASTVVLMGFPIPEKPGYLVEPGPVVEIAAGQTKTFTVSLTPTSASDYNGKMEIAYDDELLVVNLTGSGQETNGYQVYASRDYEGKSYLIEAKVDRSGSYRLNPDGSKFYPAQFRYTFGDEQFELPDTFYIDADCEDKARITSCVATNLSTKDHYVFVFEKDDDAKNYTMTGYMYVVNGGSIKQSSEIFTKKNWGWFPYFEYDDTLLLKFFSYKGYYSETAKLNADGSWTITQGSYIKPEAFQQIRAQKEANYFFENAPQGAELRSTPNSLDFGTIKVGSSSQKSFQITNTGDTGTQAEIKAPTGFSVSPSSGVYVNPGETKDFTVLFTPTEAIDYSGHIAVSFDGGVSFITLTAVGIASTASNPEAVDLGLSVKWGSCNIGATTPEGYGEYYSWGGLEPVTVYDWAHYRYGSSATSLTKYCIRSSEGIVDNQTVLLPEDDVATQTLKDNWRMPTEAEFNELLENCTWSWTKQNGVSGYKVTSKTNGNSIFLPAPGQKSDSDWYNPGSVGYYWSSTLSSNSGFARGLCIYSSKKEWMNYGRDYGHSIRPVYGESTAVNPDPGGGNGEASLTTSKSKVELYAVTGNPSSVKVQLKNTGSQQITLSAVQCPNHILTDCKSGTIIKAGEQIDVTITFAPTGSWAIVNSPLVFTYGNYQKEIAIQAVGGAYSDVDELGEMGVFDLAKFNFTGSNGLDAYIDPTEGFVLVYPDTEVGDYDEISMRITNNQDDPLRFVVFGSPEGFFNDADYSGSIYSYTLINSILVKSLEYKKYVEYELTFYPKEKKSYSGTYTVMIFDENSESFGLGCCFPLTLKGKGI